MADPSLPHIEAIDGVLRALPSDLSVARALIVLEDASAALMLGLRLGLSLESIVTQCATIVGEERAAQYEKGQGLG